jgi:hypothetical protein
MGIGGFGRVVFLTRWSVRQTFIFLVSVPVGRMREFIKKPLSLEVFTFENDSRN